MNTLMHVGEDIVRLLDRVDCYNEMFPATALRFVGFQLMSATNVYPVFAQPFVPNARFATEDEIAEYMLSKGFQPMTEEGCLANDEFVLTDIKPKNVLRTADNTMFVIDADIRRK